MGGPPSPGGRQGPRLGDNVRRVRDRRRVTALGAGALLAGTLAGCGTGPSERPVWPGVVCAERLPPEPTRSAAAPPLRLPTSRLVVEVKVDARAMTAELEKTVPRRVV